jgi:hypothetical protein
VSDTPDCCNQAVALKIAINERYRVFRLRGMGALSKSDVADLSVSTTKAIPENINGAGRHLVTSASVTRCQPQGLDEWSHPEFLGLGVNNVYCHGRIERTPGALIVVLAVSNPE